MNAGEQPLVVRKLASSLATIFLKPNAPWTHALLTLGASLANGKYITEEQCESISLENAVLPAMAEPQVVSLLYFSNILAEEIEKWNAETRRHGDIEHAAQNIENAFGLIEFVLRHILQQEASGNPVSDVAPGIEAINSYQVSQTASTVLILWYKLTCQAWMSVRSILPQLRNAISPAKLTSATTYIIQSLKVPSVSRLATQVLLEQIDWRDSVFNLDHVHTILDYITSDLGTSHIAALMDGDFDDEHITFLDLLLAYSTFKQRELFAGQLTPPHEKVLSLLHMLLKAPGYAAVDDTAAPLVIEWWTEVADDLLDMLEDAEGQPGFAIAKQNLARVALDCFQKLMYPDSEELREWSDEDRSEFTSFRRDACDFLLAVYPMLGVELIHVFQEHAKSSLVNRDWKTFEAAIFCMSQLSEAVDENQHADQCLNDIFFGDEFAQICGGEIKLPSKARQTLVDMLGKYESYFERSVELLPRVLTFLFASLDISSCAPAASKSISYLCKSCRKSLTVELPAFLDQFEGFRFKPTATALTMEKVLEGIAAIIQTLTSDEEKGQYLERILRFFLSQAELARKEASNGETETAYTRGQMVLRCVASIGKGLRTDEVIDLNDDTEGGPYPPTFWNNGDGAVSQNLIMQCMQLLINDFPFDFAILEAACNILKAGYTEKAGPYVLPPAITVNFIKSIPLGSTGADMVMSTASAFLASHTDHPQSIQEETIALILHVYETFCWMHERPESYDPEVANSGIDFLTRLLPKYHLVLFTLTSPPPDTNQTKAETGIQRPPVLNAILNFTLIALQSPEPLPLRSASQFWVTVLTLPGTGNPNDPGPVQRAIGNSLPALCNIIITQLGGRCARSDLEHLCEVLRKIIFKHQGLARPHLTEALSRLGTEETGQGQSITVSSEDKDRFLASLLAARGGKAQTAQVARSFWIKCRGAGFNYIE